MTATHHDNIAILDCGAQYTKVIDRRIRELNVETTIFPLNVNPQLLQTGFAGIILSGGPFSVYEADAPKFHPDLFQLPIPILGICYGMQLMNRACGGHVAPGHIKEYGETVIQVDSNTSLFKGLETHQRVLMSHGDHVDVLAPGFHACAWSDQIIAGIANPTRQYYGVQFHPEVELSENGKAILSHFVLDICQAKGTFKLEDRLAQTLEEIRAQVGQKKVLVLVSGGVDSSVTAALLLKALSPDQVYAVHVDSGLMRHNESDLVCDALTAIGLKHLQRLDAEADFLNGCTTLEDGSTIGPLCEETQPERKRRIIGDVFFRLTEKAIAALDLDFENTFIAQGTLRPDLIESGNREISQTAHTIKTHHNDVPLIRAQREKGLIIEPNRDWHKDEVRQVGRMLGLPEALVSRQPFPGPGLGIRVICATKPAAIQDEAALLTDIQTVLNTHQQESVFQATILPIQSVGVQGDGRSYKHVVMLTPKQASFSPDILTQLATELPNRVHGINRVVLNLTPKAAFTQLTLTKTTLNPDSLTPLRAIDATVTQAFHQAAQTIQAEIAQLLTVLIPVGYAYHHSIVLRAVVTSDYMTARTLRLEKEIPLAFLHTLAQEIQTTQKIDWVLWDLTSKPPATVEWE